MAVRKNPGLSEILEAFKNAREKTAMDEAEECPECPPEEQDGMDNLVEAATMLEESSEQAEQLKGAVPEAEERVVDAAEALKEVADEFIAEHTENLAKEAQLFGQIFAASCIEEMDKTATLRNTEAEAYAVVDDTLKEDQMNKIASIYDDAYRITMAKLAGFDDPEEMEEAAGQELDPEEMAAIVQELQDAEDEEEELTDEEIAELRDILAEHEDEDDDDDDVYLEEDEEEEILPKVANEAYGNTLSALGVY